MGGIAAVQIRVHIHNERDVGVLVDNNSEMSNRVNSNCIGGRQTLQPCSLSKVAKSTGIFIPSGVASVRDRAYRYSLLSPLLTTTPKSCPGYPGILIPLSMAIPVGATPAGTGATLICGAGPVRSTNCNALVPSSAIAAKPFAESKAMPLGTGLPPPGRARHGG